MATPKGDGPDGRGFAPAPSALEATGRSGGVDRLPRHGPTPDWGHEPGRGNGGAQLRTLLRQLSQDTSQLAHDELTLAKMELRSVVDTFTADLRDAGRTLVKDLAKVGMALSLAVLAALALTAGLILAIGDLLDAYWAGGLIVGAIYGVAAAVFGMSAGKDLQNSESLRLEATRRQAEQNRDVLAHEVRETKEFAREQAADFKRHASPGRDGSVRH